jgi:uncharacterized protein with GYD domain
MSKYIVLSKLTDEGAKTLKSNPGRVKEVNNELENMGVKVLEQFAVLGEFDFINIVEAPDNATVAKAMVELASRGSVRTRTLPVLPMDEFLAKLG